LNLQTQSTQSPPLIKVQAATAAEVCQTVYIDKQAKKLLRPEMTPREFVEALMEKQQYMAAVDFMAHALPVRETIWWACLCLQHTCGDKLVPWEKAAAKAAARWVLQPTEENRIAAKHPAEVLGLTSPAGALAAAVDQTGGSIAPPNAPPMPPSPFAPARAVAISIKLASTKVEPVKIQATQKGLVELGIGVAEGRFAI
jgi:hypothetical protein